MKGGKKGGERKQTQISRIRNKSDDITSDLQK